MFKFIKRLFSSEKIPSPMHQMHQVMLRMHDDVYLLSEVTWRCGRAYAAPYGERTTCLLAPGGAVVGQSYIKEWLPATDSMNNLFNSQPKAD